MKNRRRTARHKRHKRIRKKLFGLSEKPRFNIYKSFNHIYVQIIDDSTGHTLTSASSLDKKLRKQLGTGGNVKAAKEVGTLVASRALDKGIKKVVFDRGGYPYHGRVSALADAAREKGLEF
ncbi:MAG: 50S ribosomal protein L18 [Thermodesulfovibrionia bacterium]|nr:50S ribosomal protein L18 [Thermodesulfovibrionia bacterium]